MSPEADVLEMKSLLEELAESLLPRGTDQAQATALQREFRTPDGKPLFTWNRALELLKGKAKRVHGFEKDNARQRVAALRKEERADAVRASQENYRTLEARIASLEALFGAGDEEFGREHLAAVRAASRGQGESFASGREGNGPDRSSQTQGEATE